MTDRAPITPPGLIGVGMSGGLDSTVAAALLQEQGRQVMGLTLHMFKEGSRCCSIEDIDRARRICDLLEIPHATVNVVEYFRQTIIEPFVAEYARGRTPSPCVLCNQYVKFGALHTRALQLGCTHVATGHYVRVDRRDGRYRLLRARDRSKDQSYFLHRLSQAQLARCLFPLESWTKAEVAAYARDRGLPVNTSSKFESQDLCFVPDDGHASFVEGIRPDLRATGEIETPEGRTVGRHEGFHRFTVGQRKGLGVAATERLYVRQLDPARNRVVVATRDQLYDREFTAADIHWVSGTPPPQPLACEVRVRYRTGMAGCRLEPQGDRNARILLDEPQFAVTPGQAAVFYQDEEVLGGGWIEAVVSRKI